MGISAGCFCTWCWGVAAVSPCEPFKNRFSVQDNLMGLVDTASLAFKIRWLGSPLSGAELPDSECKPLVPQKYLSKLPLFCGLLCWGVMMRLCLSLSYLLWCGVFFHVHPMCGSFSGSLGGSLICSCRFGMPMGGVELKIPLCDCWYCERWKNTLFEITMI